MSFKLSSDDVFFFDCLLVRLFCSLLNNKISKSSISFLESVPKRNAEFAKHQPSLLALRLACRRRELHVANELWEVVAINFLLPLYAK